jgi:predicted Holliday junction resolvase-like endonuclease
MLNLERMNSQIEFYQNLRKTFIHCSCCNKVYRSTDSHIFKDKLPNKDWKQKLNEDIQKLDKQEQLLKTKIEKLKNEAKVRGRQEADIHVEQFDKVFKPLGLNPNDCKNICSPVDFIVFNGMHSGNVKNLVFLDNKRNKGQVQDSIREIIENERYTFKTLRVEDDGKVSEE